MPYSFKSVLLLAASRVLSDLPKRQAFLTMVYFFLRVSLRLLTSVMISWDSPRTLNFKSFSVLVQEARLWYVSLNFSSLLYLISELLFLFFKAVFYLLFIESNFWPINPLFGVGILFFYSKISLKLNAVPNLNFLGKFAHRFGSRPIHNNSCLT